MLTPPSEIHDALVQTVRRFVNEHLKPLGTKRDHAISDETWAAFDELELWGLWVDEPRGGIGLDALAFAMVSAELVAGWPSLAHTFAMHAGPAAKALEKTDLDLSAFCEGERATYANGALGPAPRGFWLRAEDSNLTVLEESRVEPVRMMALEGAGFGTFEEGVALLSVERDATQVAVEDLAIASLAYGAAKASLEAAQAYALERQQFGRPIAKFQAIQFKIADMKTQTSAAWECIHLATQDLDPVACATARLVSTRAALFAASEALQVHGGYGFTREYPVERFLRAARHWAAGPSAAKSRIATEAIGR